MNPRHTCRDDTVADALVHCIPCTFHSLQMLSLRVGHAIVDIDDTYDHLRTLAEGEDRCVRDEKQAVADAFAATLSMLNLLVARLADLAEHDEFAPLLQDSSVLLLEASIGHLQRAYRIDLSNMDCAPPANI